MLRDAAASAAWTQRSRSWTLWVLAAGVTIALAGCGTNSHQDSAPPPTTATATAGSTALPGTGKPQVTIGDKNFTEQFLLGQLYAQALRAQGFSVILNQSIGPTEVTMQALQSGRLDMYPEYLGAWNSQVAGDTRKFRTSDAAYRAGQRYALAHGLELLNPTPFSDTSAIGVTFNYALANRLNTIGDLNKIAQSLTFGAPPQFQQTQSGLPAVAQAYGFVPASFKPLEIGEQYQALDQGTVQAADVNTSDGQLVTGNYTLLADPLNVFGWGNVVPVISARVLDAEGTAFASTVNKVSALLTLSAMRQLNAAVDLSHEDPAIAAHQFLLAHGLLAGSQS
jgi:osmoprotectant transport system substrate-binding protein